MMFPSLLPERFCTSCGSKNVEYLRPGTVQGAGVEPVEEGVETYKCRECGAISNWATPIMKTILRPIQPRKLPPGDK